MAEDSATTIKNSPYTIRPVMVRALCDCDTFTHTFKKGQIGEIQSDHAEILVKEGKVEILSERAVLAEYIPAKEKRGG